MDRPSPPDSIPKYIAEGVPKQDNQGLRELQSWIDELLEYRSREIDEQEIEADSGEQIVGKEKTSGGGWIVKKLQQCGKDCGGCPHGPYTFSVSRDESGDEHWEYIGKA